MANKERTLKEIEDTRFFIAKEIVEEVNTNALEIGDPFFKAFLERNFDIKGDQKMIFQIIVQFIFSR